MPSLGARTLWRTGRGSVARALASVFLLASCVPADPVEPTGTSRTPTVSAELSSGSRPAFYVSPTGSPSGDGSLTNPWDLQTALNHPTAVQPGDTIWLRGGRYAGGGQYHGNYVSYLNGTAANPVIVRQYPGERATIDGVADSGHVLIIAGSYTWYWGFEIMTSGPTTWAQWNGLGVLIFSGVGNRLVNLVIHDAPFSGIGSFTPPYGTSSASTIHGCLVYNNGTHFNLDHGLYLQNDVTSGTLTVTDNIVFNNWAFGIHIYGDAGAAVSGFDIEGNVVFGNGTISVPYNRISEILIGGNVPASNIVASNNYSYREVASSFDPNRWAFGIGSTWGAPNNDVVLQDNYIVGGLHLTQWAAALVRGNLLYDYSGPMAQTEPSVSGYSGGLNQFHGDSTLANWIHLPNAPTSFATWKIQTGFSSPGSYAGSGAPPNAIFVRPNQYEAGRANIIVYNWANLATVNVDLAGVLEVGDRYVVQNAQDFYGPPVASGTYGGGSIPLPMAGVAPPDPIGRAFTPAPVTGPTFNVFVVMKTP